MEKFTLFDTVYGKASGLAGQAKQALTFMIKQQKRIFPDQFDMKSLESVRSYIRNPLTELYQRITDSGKLNSFTIMNLSELGSGVPALLTMNEITIDGAALKDLEIPQEFKKPWVNITPYVGKRDAYNGSISITDVPSLCALFVRALFCASYNDSDVWLNPKLSSFVVESYSMTLADLIVKPFNLSYEDRKFVQTLFAIHVAQLLAAKDEDLTTPPLLYRCPFLGSPAEIKERVERIAEFRADNGNSFLSIDVLVKILNKLIPRLESYQTGNLYRSFSAAPIDSQSMLISIDYPPYWVYLMMKVACGTKNPIISNVVKQLGLKNKLNEFAAGVLAQSSLIERFTR